MQRLDHAARGSCVRRRNGAPVSRLVFGLLFCLMRLTLPSYAVELWSGKDDQASVSLDTALKFSLLGSYGPDDPLLFPDRATGMMLGRMRLTLNTTFSPQTTSEVAYEQRARWYSSARAAGTGSAILPSFAEAPYRLGQLDWRIGSAGDRFEYRHEIDRAFIAYRPDWGAVTIGRQAIGLGRALMFSAVDVFSPFSPAEVDREWRRGVDAVRLECKLTDRSSAEIIGVFGESWDESAALCRIRGYLGNLDGEFIIGKRARDFMVAGVVSAVVGDAAVHGELAFYGTPDNHPDGGTFGNDHLVSKAVLGGSYTFNVGNGLTLFGEYHYNGFGIKDTDQTHVLFRNEDLQERLLRGDGQSLGRHALGLQLTYPINQMWTCGLLVLQNPVDGSGLVSPSVRWDFSQTGSLSIHAFAPWGQSPESGHIRSEYGSAPFSLFSQVNFHF